VSSDSNKADDEADDDEEEVSSSPLKKCVREEDDGAPSRSVTGKKTMQPPLRRISSTIINI
jgi:hypothetical protein